MLKMKWGSWGAPGLVLGAWTRSDFYLRSHAIMRPGPRDDARDNNMVHVHMVMPLRSTILLGFRLGDRSAAPARRCHCTVHTRHACRLMYVLRIAEPGRPDTCSWIVTVMVHTHAITAIAATATASAHTSPRVCLTHLTPALAPQPPRSPLRRRWLLQPLRRR